MAVAPAIGLLGPLAVTAGDEPVTVAGRHTRVLLAALLLQRDRVLPVDLLIDTVWGDTPPRTARVQIRNRMVGLRKTFAGHGFADVISTRGSGYLLPAARVELDLDRFDRLLAEAERYAGAGADAPAVRALDEALALWRGPALDGLTDSGLFSAAQRLEKRRTDTRVRRAELQLRLGRAAAAIAEFAELAERHPWDERVAARLMTALRLAGRPGEALLAFDRLRRALADELGVDPGAEVTTVRDGILQGAPERGILQGRPEPARTGRLVPGVPQSAPEPRTGRLVPRELPRDIAAFVGRAEALRRLDAALAAGGATPRIAVLEGTAGVGKTTLAVHWAHRVAERFDDGQLYLDLGGFAPAAAAVGADKAVRRLLEALRVPAARLPSALEGQIGLYRSIMAERRMLLVLDNARDAEQVRPLLPGSPRSMVVVTSRNQLLSLAVKDGAQRLRLDVMPSGEAGVLFTGRVGASRVAAEPRAADVIVARCAGLPLALAVVAARVGTRPGRALGSLADELCDAQAGLDPFDIGAADTDVRAVFSWSYRTLGEPAARLFRLLGLHPGPDVSLDAAVSLAARPPREVRRTLADLARAHLVTPGGPGRWAMHDLLRVYSTELARAHEPDEERRAAVVRLLDHYLATAHAAAVGFRPHRRPIDPPRPAAGVVARTFADREAAAAWFAAERQMLLAAVRLAVDAGCWGHAWRLAWCLADFLDHHGHWHDLLAVQRDGWRAARRTGDVLAEAHSHAGLGRAHGRRGRHERALPHLDRARELFAELGDGAGQAYLHRGMAFSLEMLGRQPEAMDHDLRALDLYRRAGDEAGQASALNGIGWSHAQLGRLEAALTACGEALELHRRTGNRHGQASAMDSIGYVLHRLGRPDEAGHHYGRALALFREIGDRFSEADTLTHIGDLHHAAGDPARSVDAWRGALTILEASGHPGADDIRERLARPALNAVANG
ncbi:BTAD domain-containing putative transcriptional regulator [Dactylosporangium sp. NPDC049140]|uniref:AfsR/SARP family transcriptional regulator n=1 Tax=Dactylosporangium sp. NPDC049140 TaxID=3155647 RepID=UPI0033FB3CA7